MIDIGSRFRSLPMQVSTTSLAVGVSTINEWILKVSLTSREKKWGKRKCTFFTTSGVAVGITSEKSGYTTSVILVMVTSPTFHFIVVSSSNELFVRAYESKDHRTLWCSPMLHARYGRPQCALPSDRPHRHRLRARPVQHQTRHR